MKICETMVTIPGGEILMRDDRKQLTWSVEIEPFLLSRFPITQELYVFLTGLSPACNPGPHKPIECVSWYDAATFCNLASRAEGLIESYNFGNGEDVLT